MTGMLDPIEQETTDGYAEVRELFRLPNKIVAAGLYVTDGVSGATTASACCGTVRLSTKAR